MSDYEEQQPAPSPYLNPPERDPVNAATIPDDQEQQPAPSPYLNPPEGNPIKAGVDTTVQAVSTPGGMSMPSPGGSETPPDLGVKRIASYLMGAGATSPDQAQPLVDYYKKQGLSDDDAHLFAIQQVSEEDGPAAAWAMIQYERTAYNAKQAFARTALNGVDGKAGDIQAAAKAATEAGVHVPDGSSVSFHADKWGVTATVSLPGTSQRQVFEMSSEQFNKYLDLGHTSQWDRLMEEGGIPVALTRVGAKPMGAGRGVSEDQSQKQDESAASAVPAAPARPEGANADMSNVNAGGEVNQKPYPVIDAGTYGQELADRAQRRFPWISQGAQREQWMSDQEEKEAERQNKVNIATQQGLNAAEAARVRGQYQKEAWDVRGQHSENAAGIRAKSNQKISDAKIAAALDNTQAVNNRAAARNITSMINGGAWATLEDNAKMDLLQKAGLPLPQIHSWFGGTSTPTTPTTPAPAVQQRKKFINGRYYTQHEWEALRGADQ